MASPRDAVFSLYQSIPAFASWPLEEGTREFPRSVEEYGTRHVAGWANVTHEERKRWSGHTIMHRYSTDVSRAKHVNEWKEVCFLAPMLYESSRWACNCCLNGFDDHLIFVAV